MRASLFVEPPKRLDLDIGATSVRTMGAGPPLLLLHGYPETHVCWHAVAPRLAETHLLVMPDLPGYGDSDVITHDDAVFSKRRMAHTLVTLMADLGHERFGVVGHDRGARVAYRMALDRPDVVSSLTVIDIIPTIDEWALIDGPASVATFHWSFLAQPGGLPETLLAGAPDAWVDHLMASWSEYPRRIASAALDEYRRCFRRREVIDGTCADYRAGAHIDVELDAADRDNRRMIDCPVLVLASRGRGDLSATWERWVKKVTFASLDGGHFLPEENPDAVLDHLISFLSER